LLHKHLVSMMPKRRRFGTFVDYKAVSVNFLVTSLFIFHVLAIGHVREWVISHA